MQLTFLVTSPRVAPGLLSWAAWSAVSVADQVLAADVDAPVVRAVRAAGHPVDVLPSPTARDLLAAASNRSVVWLASDTESEQMPGSLAVEIVAAGTSGHDLPQVEVLHGSYDVPGARLLDMVTVMDRLRTSCPWDREQTHRSLARHLLEESYETLEAIESGDAVHLREELGDLLLQVFFHARIASETENGFDIDEVAGGIVDKLVRRHPHVFAGYDVRDPPSRSEVETNWEALKAAEKGRTSVLDGVPLALPALALADKVVGRAGKAGLETRPLGTGLGDLLLGLVVDAQATGLDAEQELRDAVRRLTEAVRATEADRF